MTRIDDLKDIRMKRLGAALLLSILPAFGVYFEAGIAVRGVFLWVFWPALIVFTYLLYQQSSVRNMTASMLYYLAIEIFLFPVIVFISSVVFASQQTGPFAAAGGFIGGFIGVVISAFVAFFLGVVLYLISKSVRTTPNST